MIDIFLGPAAAIRSTVVRSALSRSAISGRPILILHPSSHPGRSWDGMRRLVTGLSDRLGSERFLSLLEEDAASASLLLDALPWGRIDEARTGELCAHLDSHLSHNWAVQRAFFNAWAEQLRRLFSELPFLVAVPDVSGLDWETMAVLKTLFRDGDAPDLLLGYTPSSSLSEQELDERGFAWGMAPNYVLEAVLGLRSIPGTTSHEVKAGEDEKEAGDSGAFAETPEWDLESRAWPILGGADGRELSADEVDLIAEAQWRSFRRFGFQSALRLGLELVDRGARLDGRLATVHAVLALSAHNRQFHAAGNLRLAERIDRHLRLALEHEQRPEVRSALLYRLAVTSGRRRGRIEEATGWADRAVEEARRVAHPWKSAYLGAWARNIRSYARMRAKLSGESKQDCEQAFKLLSEANQRGPGDLPAGEGPTRRDLAASLALLATNRSVLSWFEHDDEDFERWRGTARDLEWTQPGAARYEAAGWVEFYRHKHRPDLGLEAALDGLESARQERDVSAERRYLLEAADASYRLGLAAEARSFYQEEKTLRARLGNPPYLADPSVASAGASARAGDVTEAESLLSAAIESPNGRSPEALAEIWGAAGVLAARRGDEATAEERVNQAIELALETGERDVLLQVAIQAGQALDGLGRKEEAGDAYQRALDLAANPQDDGEPPRAGDLLKAKLGIAELSGQVGGDLFALVPDALDDPECWWALARLRRLCPNGPPQDAPQSGWQAFLAATRLREEHATESEADRDGEPVVSATHRLVSR